MLLRILTSLFLLISGAAQAQACTKMACMDGLTIDVPLEYQWKPGKYVFDFTLNGKPVHCTGSLPLKSCDQHSLNCTAEGIIITESGCALPDGHGFGMISIGSSPASVSLKITHNGQAIAQGNWKPVYQFAQPNGPQCEPICRQASVSLDFQ
jgi:hypothetical protein